MTTTTDLRPGAGATETPTTPAPLPERIRAILPDHTALSGNSFFAAAQRWTWTTPAGVWSIERKGQFMGAQTLAMAGPGGNWSFPMQDVDTAFRQLRGALLALDAISADVDTA